MHHGVEAGNIESWRIGLERVDELRYLSFGQRQLQDTIISQLDIIHADYFGFQRVEPPDMAQDKCSLGAFCFFLVGFKRDDQATQKTLLVFKCVND